MQSRKSCLIASLVFSLLSLGFFIQGIFEPEFLFGWISLTIISMITSYVFYQHRNVKQELEQSDWEFNNH